MPMSDDDHKSDKEVDEEELAKAAAKKFQDTINRMKEKTERIRGQTKEIEEREKDEAQKE